MLLRGTCQSNPNTKIVRILRAVPSKVRRCSPNYTVPSGGCRNAGHSDSLRVIQGCHPLQGTVLASHTPPEANCERLVPLVDFRTEWKGLSNISQRSVKYFSVGPAHDKKGYAVQFKTPRFSRVQPTVVETLLRKGTSSQQRSVSLCQRKKGDCIQF